MLLSYFTLEWVRGTSTCKFGCPGFSIIEFELFGFRTAARLISFCRGVSSMTSVGTLKFFRLAFKAGSAAPYASSSSSSLMTPIKISEEEILYFIGLKQSDGSGSDMISLGPKWPERDGWRCFASISAWVIPSASERTFSACSFIFVRWASLPLCWFGSFLSLGMETLRFPDLPSGEEPSTYCVLLLLAIGYWLSSSWLFVTLALLCVFKSFSLWA